MTATTIPTSAGDVLLADILANPDDDDIRLIYADYLDETGHEPRAQFIREQIELHHTPGCRHSTFYGNCRRCNLHTSVTDLLRENHVAWSGELMRFLDPDGHCLTSSSIVGLPSESRWRFNRGFVDEVTCPLAGWLKYGTAIVARHPVQRVTAKGRTPRPSRNKPGQYLWFDLDGYGDGRGSQDPKDLPSAVWSLLTGQIRKHEESFKAYDSVVEAEDDLSAALILHAKQPARD